MNGHSQDARGFHSKCYQSNSLVSLLYEIRLTAPSVKWPTGYNLSAMVAQATLSLALKVTEHGLALEQETGKLELARWTREQARASRNQVLALKAAQVAFWQGMTLADYTAVTPGQPPRPTPPTNHPAAKFGRHPNRSKGWVVSGRKIRLVFAHRQAAR